MWKIFSVPCGSALYKFHCIYKYIDICHMTRAQKLTEAKYDAISKVRKGQNEN
jgi:hypothetical protein